MSVYVFLYNTHIFTDTHTQTHIHVPAKACTVHAYALAETNTQTQSHTPDNPLVVQSLVPSWYLALTWIETTQSVIFFSELVFSGTPSSF